MTGSLEADINETYSEAVNVLSGLEVFRGYTDGSYQPQASHDLLAVQVGLLVGNDHALDSLQAQVGGQVGVSLGVAELRP